MIAGRGSIRARLFTLVLAVAVPLVGLLMYWIWWGARDEARDARASSFSLAQLGAAHTDQFFAEMETLLAGLSRRPLIRAMDPSQCDPIIDELRDLDRRYAGLAVIDRSAQVVCSTVQPTDIPLASLTATRWYQRMMVTDGFVVGDPFFGPATGSWVSVMSYPIHDTTGAVAGRVALPVDLVESQSALTGITLPAGAVITVLDDEGTVVGRSLQPELWIGRNVRDAEVTGRVLAQPEGRVEARDPDGVRRIVGYTTVRGAGWHLYVGFPSAEVYGSIRAAVLRSSMVALVIIVLAGATAVYLSRAVERPIHALGAAADAAARGQTGARVPAEGPAEIAELAARFNEMLSARSQAEDAVRQSAQRLNLALDAGGLVTWDWNMRTAELTWSDNLERLEAEAVITLPRTYAAFIEQVLPDDREIVAGEIARAVVEHHDYHVQFRTEWPDGNLHWLEARGQVRYDEAGRPVRMLGIGADITARKRAEDEHARLQLQAAAAAAAVETDRLKTELLNTVSHELRTPLGAIKGFTTALLLFPERLQPEERQDFLREIDAATDRLDELVENLLQLARLEADTLRIECEPAALGPVLVRAVEEARRRHPDRVIELDLADNLPVVSADRRRMGQVAANLIDNAIKYSPAGGEIGVRARPSVDGGIEFSVTDHGIGIDAEHHSRIFERFYRVDNSNVREVGGTGLGLAICRRIVEQHQGRIAVVSHQGQGSTFTVTLPGPSPAASGTSGDDGTRPQTVELQPIASSTHDAA